ncbi:MAG: hypothetical protein BRD51_05480 [Bacteroidetes bacterium SW_11_64_17]|nr:MAG: hypothetical protein BRD51_05480 [Bacteroidetes bacterium SW_11_64_17]
MRDPEIAEPDEQARIGRISRIERHRPHVEDGLRARQRIGFGGWGGSLHVGTPDTPPKSYEHGTDGKAKQENLARHDQSHH